MPAEIHVQRFSGPDVKVFIPELARLRILVFRDYPYLYDGSLAYEEKYLQTYTDSPGSVVVVAFEGDRVIGASTGVPLEHETAEVQKPLVDLGCDVERIFYFGESVLQREYRGRGLGVRFFQEREAHAMSFGHFDTTCFCAVSRPPDHPLRPADYLPLDDFWRRRGYQKHPELRAFMSWKELDEADESTKAMEFWMKDWRGSSP